LISLISTLSEFVRIQSLHGLYRGDLGRVQKVEGGDRVWVRLKPRIQLHDQTSDTRGKKIRPQPSFLTYEFAKRAPNINQRSLIKRLHLGVECFEWDDNWYTVESGHTLKAFPLAKVALNVQPTPAEERLFSNSRAAEEYARDDQYHEDVKIRDFAQATLADDLQQDGNSTFTKDVFAPGDRVKVVAGQLKGMKATVRRVLENRQLMLEPLRDNFGSGAGGMVTAAPSDCLKTFDVGGRVKVIQG